jgi:hypothetical protein
MSHLAGMPKSQPLTLGDSQHWLIQVSDSIAHVAPILQEHNDCIGAGKKHYTYYGCHPLLISMFKQ